MTQSSGSFTLRLLGGLGNQLHGVAAGYVIGGNTGLTPVFDGSDIPWGSNASRKIEVDKFVWPAVYGTSSSIKMRKPFITPVRNGPHQRVAARMRDKIKKQGNLVSIDSYEEREAIFEAAASGLILSGYFNDYEWIASAFEFGFPTFLQPRKININILESPYNAVHIRLTDYLWYPEIYPLVSEKYLLAGIENMNSNYPTYIFTDDVKTALKKFPLVCKIAKEIIGPKTMGTIESFVSMSRAKNIVTANSSFSSWAAVFVDRQGGKVITPEKMNFTSAEENRPANWVRLSISDGTKIS